ncbi:MAG: hypothetical protein QXH26_00075 [Candidatus Hadarchaeales archaeon]
MSAYTAVGVVLLLLVASAAPALRETQHLAVEMGMQQEELLRLSARARAAEEGLSNLLRQAVYLALREVCGRADAYSSDWRRERAVESLACEHLRETCRWLPLVTGGELLAEPKVVRISPADNGFVWATCELEGLILEEGPTARLRRSLERVETLVDCRFFLLQERMNEFLRRLDDLHDRWRNWEYLQAWGEAVLGRVWLSKGRTETLLKAAWAQQEIEVFGSCSPLLPPVLPSLQLPSVQPAEEALGRLIERLGSPLPLPEKIEEAEQGLEEVKRLFPDREEMLRAAASRLEGALSRIENRFREARVELEAGREKEAERIIARLLEEGESELEKCWVLGKGGLERVEREVPKLDDPTLPALKRFLEGVREELGLFGCGELPSLPHTAEWSEVSLPKPLGPPGLSVLRELEVAKVSFRREDPLGLCGCEDATPIYLWFIGLTVWWGQWSVTVELKERPLEKIFDYENPTIPLQLPLPAHYSLQYLYRVPKESFSTRVVVLFPRPFKVTISG